MRNVERPVFVVGVDHSGTSILYRMLARHPALAWFSPYSLRGGDFPGRAWVPFHGWINRSGRRLLGVRWGKGEGRYLPQPREGVGIWRRLLPPTDGFLGAGDYTEEQAARVRRALAQELDAWKLDRMLVKVPYLTRAIGLLDRIFPDALFVHIVRDGRAVALSNRSLFAHSSRDDAEALRAAALNWVHTLEYVNALEPVLGERLTTIRYQTFCEDVHGWLTRTLRFAGLDPDAVDLGGLPRTLRPTDERWLLGCSPPDQRLLNGILAETLQRWGYEAFAAAPRPAAEPRRTARGGRSPEAAPLGGPTR
jgi:hypothetical protein